MLCPARDENGRMYRGRELPQLRLSPACLRRRWVPQTTNFSFGAWGFRHTVSARRADIAALHLVVVPQSISFERLRKPTKAGQ
ncbi:hypothetical protein MIC448_730001 [Microbacterium sp. C448]|nr:hypothetical protein MIC448_730001 [Microbacterium sp. C448]